MKITDLQVVNVMGLKGHRTYIPGKVNILCADNGRGKTSFETAVRYILCGQAPKNMITEGAPYAAVQMKADDGVTYIRQKYADPKKASKFYIKKNDKTVPVTQSDMAKMIAGGIGQDAVKWSVNGDILSSFDQKKFGEFLFSYIPEEMTMEQIYSMIPGITEQMKKIIHGIVKDKEFLGIEDITKIYNWCYDYRPKCKALISKAEGFISAYSEQQHTKEEADAAKEELKKLEEALAKATMYEQALRTWENASAQREKVLAQIKEMEEKIAQMGEVKDEKTIAKALEKAEKKLSDLTEERAQAQESLSRAGAAVEELQKSISILKENKGVCPYSRYLTSLGDDTRIECSTDMSPFIDSLQTVLKDIEAIKKEAEKALKKKETAYGKALEAVNMAGEERRKLEQKTFFEKNLISLKEGLPAQTEKPERPALTKEEIGERMTRARNIVFSFENRERYAKARADKEAAQEYLGSIEAILKAASPKGVIKTTIFENYVQAFEESINKRAKSISEDMSVKFVTEEGKGIGILFSPRGDGYRDFASLSGGEKAMLIYLVLDMVNSLTGLRILLIDEMSVLDDNVLEELIKVFSEHQDDYDHVFIAIAYRKGIEDVAKKYGAELLVP